MGLSGNVTRRSQASGASGEQQREVSTGSRKNSGTSNKISRKAGGRRRNCSSSSRVHRGCGTGRGFTGFNGV